MSDSPRTDKASWRQHDNYLGGERELVTADFARTLERENFVLAAGQCCVKDGLLGDEGGTPYCRLQRENAKLREALRLLFAQVNSLDSYTLTRDLDRHEAEACWEGAWIEARAALKGEGG